jgi:hypothetical protein
VGNDQVERLVGKVESKRELKWYSLTTAIIPYSLFLYAGIIFSQGSLIFLAAVSVFSLPISFYVYKQTMKDGQKALESWKNLDPKVRGGNRQ